MKMVIGLLIIMVKYNYKELKKELEKLGYVFKTNSDTEVIINSFDKWGINSINKFHGMFAFALWNIFTEKLYLVRDRVGVKPLYWYLKNNLLIFASEIKAFHLHPNFEKEINKDSIPHYLRKGYINPKTTIFKNLHNVIPGSILEFDKNLNYKKIQYWDLTKIYLKSKLKNISINKIEKIRINFNKII